MSNKNGKENDLQKKFEATLELALRQNRDEFLKKQSAEHETRKKEPSEEQSKSHHKKKHQNQ